MGSSGLTPRRKQSMLRRIGLMMVGWHLSSPLFGTSSESWDWDMSLLSQRSANSLWSFNAFLGTLVVDPEMYFMILAKPPYHDILHTLSGEHSAEQWAR
ncbi:hypothetical protein HAX54_029690, partial [Datura stramonium]|nr:hypothetical protein [Datura stramonium]